MSNFGLYGASNGGLLLVGAAVTQRPELLRAAVALVPLFDMGRFNRERFAEWFCWEYGDPRRPEEAAWLRANSPYRNVREGVRYPAMLIVCGTRAIRAQPLARTQDGRGHVGRDSRTRTDLVPGSRRSRPFHDEHARSALAHRRMARIPDDGDRPAPPVTAVKSVATPAG